MSFLLPAFIAFDSGRSLVIYAIISNGHRLPPSLVTAISEASKLVIATVLYLRWKQQAKESAGLVPRKATGQIDFKNVFATALPASLYLLNNSLYLLALRYASPAVLGPTLLAKLPLTAVLHRFSFGKRRSTEAWLSLGFLSLGLFGLHMPWASVVAVLGAGQISALSVDHESMLGPLLGLLIALISSLTSVFTESLLKQPLPFWAIQWWLYLYGTLFAVVTCGVTYGLRVPAVNTKAVLLAVTLMCIQGIFVSNILRHGDNIVKLIGASSAVAITLLLQPFFFPDLWLQTFAPTKLLAIGLIVTSTWCYNFFKDTPASADYPTPAALLTPSSASPEESKEEEKSLLEDVAMSGRKWYEPTWQRITAVALFFTLCSMSAGIKKT